MNTNSTYQSIIDLVKISWRKYANEIAIDNGVDQVTFRELEERVTALSNRIISEAPDEQIIALTTTRGIQLIVNVLAILHAGKTYLPIDSTFPKARISQIVEDCGVKFYLKSNEGDSLDLQAIDINGVAEAAVEAVHISNYAYILYTSGSTGAPKGVCVPHAGIINLIQWQEENSCSRPGIKTLQFTRITFDISVQEIFSTLCSGGTLQVVDAAVIRDYRALVQVLNEQKVQRLFLPFVSLQGIANEAESSSIYPVHLQEVMTCGEQLKSTRAVKALFDRVKTAKLFNQYGPTECTCIVTQLELPKDTSKWDDLPTIGKAISGVESLILDTELRPITEPNVPGELYFAGICLSEGYLNKPELTQKSFFPLSLPGGSTKIVYKTGDLAYYTPEKEIFFLGRIDDQVKISGFRVETGEIEAVAAALTGVQQVVIIVKEYEDGQKYLALFYVGEGEEVKEAQMLAYLKERLPVYMIPSSCVRKESFAQTSNGKIDRKALAQDVRSGDTSKVATPKSNSSAEAELMEIWKRILNLEKISRDANFFELGGSSFLAQRMAIEINKIFEKDITVTKIYQYPIFKSQAAYLNQDESGLKEFSFKKKGITGSNRDVAVIATAGRFPGASNSTEFWELIKDGKETISFFELAELDPSEQVKAKSDPNYIKARGIIEDIKDFDYEFFGFNLKLASIMDPQQRLFLEVAFEALDSAGYIANKPDYRIGVFAGCSTNYYYTNNLVFDRDLTESLGNIQINSVNEKDYLATRVAYLLDLEGPAVSINTACSTALVAIANAVRSIRSGECTAAIAGSTSVAYPVHSGHSYEEGSILSKDGHCKPFDAEASGTLFSDGGGAVLLKDFEQAVADGDPILAVIKGVGINNDGANKSSFSAPSVIGQANAIRMALEDGQVNPSEIGYVEAHGTATPIGDPIEVEGLKLAFGTQVKPQACALGSVKGNVGHLNAAAGIAGMIKTVYALHERTLPKSIGFTQPNPTIKFEETPFYIQQETKDWESTTTRKAGVSSFGIGGTNCHIILEEYVPAVEVVDSASTFTQTIHFSANTGKSLQDYAGRLKNFVGANPTLSLGQFGYNVNKNNGKYSLGSSVTFSSKEDLLAGLDEVASGSRPSVKRKGTFDFPVFLFPGQGAQYVNMGRELYENEPVFKLALDKCDGIYSTFTGTSILNLLFAESPTEAEEAKLADTRFTQPTLFAVSYSLAELWKSKGVSPSAVLGHSIGEFAAACMSGVLSVEDAIKIVAKRGEIISKLNAGSMLSIRAAAADIIPLLPENLTIAGDNAPNLCVASGPAELIESFAAKLAESNIPSKVLHTSHAFHSAMMDPALNEFHAFLHGIQFSIPKIPIMSTVTGEWMKDAEATSPEYWTQHMRLPVQYNSAVKNLLREFPAAAFVEVGPGNTLGTLLLQQEEAKGLAVVESLNRTSEISENAHFQQQFNALIGKGLMLDWSTIYPAEFHKKMLLPAYAFDKKRCWIDVNIAHSEPKHEENVEDEPLDAIDSGNIDNKEAVLMVLKAQVSKILQGATGVKLSEDDLNLGYFELGLDSLSLTQIAFSLKKEFKIEVSFRQLNGELNTPMELVNFLLNNSEVAKHLSLPEAKKKGPNGKHAKITNATTKKLSFGNSGTSGDAEVLTSLENLDNTHVYAPELTDKGEVFIAELIHSYQAKTALSRKNELDKLKRLAGSGIGAAQKYTRELTYPIIINYSKGSQLTDLDGNTYIDWLNDSGNQLFGYQPDFINKAIIDQIYKGVELSSQYLLQEEICDKISRLTHSEQVHLFNNGTEALLHAISSGTANSEKNLVVLFTSSPVQEGQLSPNESRSYDNYLAAKVLDETGKEVLFLEYGSAESLQTIAKRAREIAVIAVEPVQLQRLEFLSIDFLSALRDLTTADDICLIFDERLTGFRAHLDGFQALYLIRADITVYGSVLGGGFSIAAIAGKSQWLGASNSGKWRYGVNSSHMVSNSAGEFGIHPLTLSTTYAVLNQLEEKGNDFQNQLANLAERMVNGLNSIFEKYNVSYFAVSFRSVWEIKVKHEFAFSELLFALLRLHGIHIWKNLTCYVTDAHTENDVRITLEIVEEAVRLLVENELAEGDLLLVSEEWMSMENPPFQGAKIALDSNGFPFWATA